MFACVVLQLQFTKTSKVQKACLCFSDDFLHQIYFCAYLHGRMSRYLFLFWFSGALPVLQSSIGLTCSKAQIKKKQSIHVVHILNRQLLQCQCKQTLLLYITQDWKTDFLQKRISASFSKLPDKECNFLCIYFTLQNISAFSSDISNLHPQTPSFQVTVVYCCIIDVWNTVLAKCQHL